MDAMNDYVIPLLRFALKSGDTVTLQADNGKYLSRINHGDRDPVEAVKDSPDVFSQFEATVLTKSRLVLKADDGKYLSRINRGNIDTIDAVKDSPDVFCEFTVTALEDGKIALSADTGKFLARVPNGGDDPIEVVPKESPDESCLFTIHRIQ